MSHPPIHVEELSKAYGDLVAVRGLNLTVEQGEAFGFLGPNGAGKTTSVKMLLGLVRPSAGRGWLLGEPLGTPKSRARVGFLPEQFAFHPWLTATEFLQLHADLAQVPADIAARRIPALLERVDLASFAHARLRTFSKGMLQRAGLAQALINDPELIFLDEPTSGLDPVGRRLVRDIIHEQAARGATVFLNSHLLSEVEVTCDRVGFVRKGQLVRTMRLGDDEAVSLTLTVRGRAPNPEAWTAAVDGLRRWSSSVQEEGGAVTLSLSGEADIPEVARWLLSQGIDLYELAPRRATLEDLFMQLVAEEEVPA